MFGRSGLLLVVLGLVTSFVGLAGLYMLTYFYPSIGVGHISNK